jgi:predicted nucleotidyltransferase
VKYTPIWLEDKRQNMFEEMIGSYLARLKECGFDNNIEIKSVILFGSVARGEAKEHSDIDLIVVTTGLPELKRRDELPPFRSLARIQDIWMTPEEKIRKLEHGRMIPRSDLNAVISSTDDRFRCRKSGHF